MRYSKYLLIALFIPFNAFALSLDERLNMVISINKLKAATCSVSKEHMNSDLSLIGEALFNLKQLSGHKDTSCATCHLEDKHLTDGLPIAIGVGGGDLEGVQRQNSDGFVVPRNTFTLFGRANNNYKNFFWDGRVENINERIMSPIGNKGFNSALEIAAILPLLARDEFLGKHSLFFSSEEVEQVDNEYYEQRAESFNKFVKTNLLNQRDEPEVKKLFSLMEENNIDPSKIDLNFIGKSIAAFLADNDLMNCKPSNWDIYLMGDNKILNDKQKRGALIFFGKGRCASCHSGSLFSDFTFHSLGTPQGEQGTYMHGQDIGRAEVTFMESDRYKFRTPSLLGVAKTPPYAHNGAFSNLQEVVLFHLNPIEFFVKNGWSSKKEYLSYGRLISARSKRLGYIDVDNEKELNDLLAFLSAL